jgi:hypothetical protein
MYVHPSNVEIQMSAFIFSYRNRDRLEVRRDSNDKRELLGEAARYGSKVLQQANNGYLFRTLTLMSSERCLNPVTLPVMIDKAIPPRPCPLAKVTSILRWKRRWPRD